MGANVLRELPSLLLSQLSHFLPITSGNDVSILVLVCLVLPSVSASVPASLFATTHSIRIIFIVLLELVLISVFIHVVLLIRII